MKVSQLRQLIREETKKVLGEARGKLPVYTKLAKEASDLYEKILDLGLKDDDSDIEIDAVDSEMESIVEEVGWTPEQKKSNRYWKFANEHAHPSFETLTDKQLKKIIPFLKAIIKSKEFHLWCDWNGTKIVCK